MPYKILYQYDKLFLRLKKADDLRNKIFFQDLVACSVRLHTHRLPVSVDIWQYTSKGTLEGANTDQGHCDLNYSYMEATSVKFKTETLTMKKGTTAVASVKLGPSGCTDTLTFTSSNKKVVVVNKTTGKLRAKAKGKATITVTTGSGKKAKMKVSVQ